MTTDRTKFSYHIHGIFFSTMYIRLCTSFLCASCIETLSKQDENGSMLNARSVFVCCYVLIVATLSLMLLLIPLFCLAFNQFHAQNNSMPIHIILLSIHVYFYFGVWRCCLFFISLRRSFFTKLFYIRFANGRFVRRSRII